MLKKAQKRKLTGDDIVNIIQELDRYLTDLKSRWDQQNPGNGSWWRVTKTYLLSATQFIIGVLDELVIFVEGIIPDGQDKKAAVMAIISKLFDYIVIQAFPVWLKPFSPMIKSVIEIIVGTLIDYIVAKYNAGFWNPGSKPEPETVPESQDSTGGTNGPENKEEK